MKINLLFLLLLFLGACHSQSSSPKVSINENGEIVIDISEKETQKLKAKGFVSYSDFGAKGDGKTDDITAIAATHQFANEQVLPVKADASATYYISGKDQTATIQTNTDWGTASFIIDDTLVQRRGPFIFLVTSTLEAFDIEGISSLKKNQESINFTLPSSCLITVTDSSVRRYIRLGLNQNNGVPQTDIFVVDKNGKVDMNAPIIWDFEQTSKITALPIDEKKLTIKGGRFTTIANKAASKYTYYSRSIAIRRSNVIVDGLEHRVIGEGEQGAPYEGFINIRDCAYVVVKNTTLTGHKTYTTIGSAGKPVAMGSYDLFITRALNVSMLNCNQTNDINDNTYWGIIASNYSKNLLYDSCTFSRFDAHMGVANATIKNSELGHMGINAIGTGILTLENSTVRGRALIDLRTDYGSTWEGEFHIRNCIFVPRNGNFSKASLIGGYNSGQHNFGYTCYMPERIIIDNLSIEDGNPPEGYQGPAIFADFNSDMTNTSFKEPFPYITTKEVVLKNVTIASGKNLRSSDNSFMFRNVKVIEE